MAEPEGVERPADRGPLRYDEAFRCTAISKRSGERCRRAAIKGGSVCATHGGAAPQVRAKANQRLAEMERQRIRERILGGGVRKLLDELEEEARGRHPIDVLLDAVSRSSAMVMLYGVLVGELEAPQPDEGFPVGAESLWGADHLGDGARHVLVAEYERWVELAARTAKMALDAGIDERRVALVEAQADQVAGVLRGSVGGIVAALRAAGVRIDSLQLERVVIELPSILRRELERASADEVRVRGPITVREIEERRE